MRGGCGVKCSRGMVVGAFIDFLFFSLVFASWRWRVGEISLQYPSQCHQESNCAMSLLTSILGPLEM